MATLPIVAPLTAHVAVACSWLEAGASRILEQVAPTTADLLRWWFQQDCVDTRTVNFHDGQRQTILHTIYAHEVIGAGTLSELYQKLAPEALLTARRPQEATRGETACSASHSSTAIGT